VSRNPTDARQVKIRDKASAPRRVLGDFRCLVSHAYLTHRLGDIGPRSIARKLSIFGGDDDQVWNCHAQQRVQLRLGRVRLDLHQQCGLSIEIRLILRCKPSSLRVYASSEAQSHMPVRDPAMRMILVGGAIFGALTALLVVGFFLFDYPRWVPFLAVVLVTPIFLTSVLLVGDRQLKRVSMRGVASKAQTTRIDPR
jgi:hypothetical protein